MVNPRPFATPRTPIERLLSPFQRFVHTEASGGIVLLICTAAALLWANSPLASSYFGLWHTDFTMGSPQLHLTMSLHHWVNDALMAVFFFLVGLEVKREFLFGELASPRKAALPIAAAVGGMVLPALLYLAVSGGGAAARGWGIPMATDIAFALGILALLGPRIPLQLKVFLAALAIADDIGAVLIIALFYTSGVAWPALAASACVYAIVIAANRAGLRWPAAYALLGIPLWLAMLASGIHASIAGVLMAAAIPARPRLDAMQFLERGRGVVDTLSGIAPHRPGVIPTAEELEAIQALEASCRFAQTPLQRLEQALHPWIAFGVVPLFALANAGVRLGDFPGSAVGVTMGVTAGLVLGKPLGITAASWLAVRLGASMPEAVSWRGLHGVSWLGGIGFTMSLFVANLAFEDARLVSAKIGILLGSVAAATVGWFVLRRELRAREPEGHVGSDLDPAGIAAANASWSGPTTPDDVRE